MNRDHAIERYSFHCPRCAQYWIAEYQVEHGADMDGGQLSFYRHNGAPVENPRADVIVCPTCRHSAVQVRFLARHDLSQGEQAPRVAGSTSPPTVD